MNLLFSKKVRLTLRNILVSYLLLVLVVLSFASKTSAQTQPPTNPTTTVQQNQTPQTTIGPNGEITVPTPTGTETGQVKQCPDLPGLGQACDTIMGGLGSIGDAILGAFKEFFAWVQDQLFSLLGRIAVNLAHIGTLILGSNTTITCTSGSCQATLEQLQAVAPMFGKDSSLAQNFNLFTLADASYAKLYNSIPEANPLNEVGYLAKENILGVDTIQAQSLNSDGLQDLGELIRDIWIKMRDLAYIASVIAMIVIGFMVMLRRRIDPKTVVTATAAIPRLAIALILITFSFAISGLFVDFIHLTVGLARDYFGSISSIDKAVSGMSNIFPGGEFMWMPFFTLISESVISWKAFVGLLGLGLIPVAGAFAFIPLLAALLVDLVIRLGLFILAVMLFWSLLIRYATLVLLVVFSPFFFLVGAIPGFEGMTFNWFKRMVAIVITFPAIVVIAYIGMALLSPTIDGGIGAPPPISDASSVLNISALVGLGVLYFAHKVPGLIDSVFKTEGPRGTGPTPFILATAAGSGLKSAGNLGKSIEGTRGLLNNVGKAGQVFQRAMFRTGYTRGEATFNPDTGNYETDQAQAKSGFTGKAARYLGGSFRGPLRSRDVTTQPGKIVKTPFERDAAMEKEVISARLAPRNPNPKNIPPEFGSVSDAELQAVADRLARRGPGRESTQASDVDKGSGGSVEEETHAEDVDEYGKKKP